VEAPSWESIEGATDRGASTKNRHVLWQTSMSAHPVQAREREEGANDGAVD
jgi:hypothetical protein